MESTAADSKQILPSYHQAPHLHAGFWRRVAAWVIDMLIVGTVHWVLVLSLGTWLIVPWAMLGGVHGVAAAKFFDTALQPIGIVIVWLYFALFEASAWQATPGKLALGLQVTGERGQRIGFARATGRTFGKYISTLILGVGFLMAGWTARKQALHDLMAGCCVVRKAGLVAWRSDASTRPDDSVPAATAAAPTGPLPPRTGMPGWGIALIVIAAGFLLVPVAAILAAFAIPAWQSYTVRAEVAQGLASTERARALFAEYVVQRGAFPGDNADLGLPRPGAMRTRYVTSVHVSGGKVVVTYGNQASPVIHGGHVVISPVGNAVLLRWHCSSPDIRDRYLPGNCR
ncbi:MAG TPA: RDD family protein [Rhodanobacteraceae bacterium]|nr:RDD family protein [Rhodanobacteraceae bacterium]